MKDNDFTISQGRAPEIFLAHLGNEARKKTLKLFEEIKKEGYKVVESLSKNGIKPQLDLANKLGVKYSLILGQKEIIDGTILIRDMEGGIQEIINFEKVISELEKRLRKIRPVSGKVQE
jgi:histidyl-tRNA synthetase